MRFTSRSSGRWIARFRAQIARPRRVVLVASAAAIAVAVSTSITHAAWTDNEWAQGKVGTISGDCTNNNLFQNRAWGRQLTGVVGGINLDTLTGVDGVTVTNDGTVGSAVPGSVTQVTPPGDNTTYISKLPVGVLGAQNSLVTAVLGLGVPVGGLGAYTQWGQAKNNGKAHGAAGLVSDQSGAVDVTGTGNGTGAAPAAAHIRLGQWLPAAPADVILNIGAVASSATMDSCEMLNGWPRFTQNPVPKREYGIAGLDLTAKIEAVKTLSTAGVTLKDSVQTTLNGLVNAGKLSTDITNGVVALLNGLLSPLALGGVKTTGVQFGNLSPLTALVSGPITDGVLTVDLAAGTVRVNIAKLVNGTNGLNNLGPNHELVLDEAVINSLIIRLGNMLDTWVEQVNEALLDVTITSTTHIGLLLGLGSIDAIVGPIAISDLLANPDSTIPEPQLNVQVLGSPSLLTSITNALVNGANKAVATAVQLTTLNGGVLAQGSGTILSALTAPVVSAAGAILSPFGALVSIMVNVQTDQPWGGTPSRPLTTAEVPNVASTGTEYKVSAIRVSLVNQAQVLALSLANSSAGPAKFRP